jgi:alkylation response protein AidB-like acyl-CoA dehydrogenase
MEKFRGVDYYGLDALLGEEERMVRDAVRDWVEAEFLPIVTEHHRAGTFPVHLIPKLGELGVFGATLKGYGCAGLSNVAYGLIMQELERGTPACGPARPCSRASSCTRSTPTAPRRSGSDGSRRSPGARRSAASVSPSRITARTPAA